MEMPREFVYNAGHETIWQCSAIGEASPPRHSAVEGRRGPVCGRAAVGRLAQFGIPLVAELSTGWLGWIEVAADTRPSAAAILAPEAGAEGTAAARAISGWFPNRPVDAGAHQSSHSPALQNSLPYKSRLADSDRLGLELPEAGAAGLAAQ